MSIWTRAGGRAAGMTVADAAAMVVRMAVPHRVPGAVRLADRLACGLEQPTRAGRNIERRASLSAPAVERREEDLPWACDYEC